MRGDAEGFPNQGEAGNIEDRQYRHQADSIAERFSRSRVM